MGNMVEKYYYVALITLEAESALSIASGLTNQNGVALVMRDFNDLPYLPGSSLKGALKALPGISDRLLGFMGIEASHEKSEGKEPLVSDNIGSNVIISDGYLVDGSGNPHPSLLDNPFQNETYRYYQDVYYRDHVRINQFGVADSEGKGKFSNELTFKGSRFMVEVRLEVPSEEHECWSELLTLFEHQFFRLGAQVTNGLGKLRVIQLKERCFNLNDSTDRLDFRKYVPDFSAESRSLINNEPERTPPKVFLGEEKTISFICDAMQIGAGHGEFDIDHVNLKEPVLVWNGANEAAELQTRFVIPGSSVKGVLRHRTIFYMNEEIELEPANELDWKKLVELSNKAVAPIFGEASNSDDGGIGNIWVDDIYISEEDVEETIFAHNVLDRFTQGTIDGLLFSEKIMAIKKPQKLRIQIYQPKSKTEQYELVMQAFEKAYDDLISGRLPIGGGVTNGNGRLKMKEYDE